MAKELQVTKERRNICPYRLIWLWHQSTELT